ncbi:hypothetical protein KZC52_07475 [Microbacterium sp. kSW2-24]|nr:hypothetical protein [Microbacterium galbinum]MCK2022758.1 hypothetical protein [Microbacterium galbinum]
MAHDRYTKDDEARFLEIIELRDAVRAEEDQAAHRRTMKRIGFRPNEEQ